MANTPYKLSAQKMMQALIDLSSAVVKAALVKNTYVVNLTTHEFFTDISTYVLGTPQTLSGKSETLGVFDANDITFAAVAAGDTALAVVLYIDTGVAGTSPLILYDDTITGFPQVTSGGDIDVKWDNGPYKIYSIAS